MRHDHLLSRQRLDLLVLSCALVYTVHLEAVFETHVPVPLVKITGPSRLPDLAPGETGQIEATLTNYGLVAAEDVEVRARRR
jgi:hypothetical protein